MYADTHRGFPSCWGLADARLLAIFSSQHNKTDQGLPVNKANFTLNYNEATLYNSTNLTLLGLEGGLEKIGKKFKKSHCATFLSSPATSSGSTGKSLSFRAAPLLWAQPCLKQASACNLAVCCLLSPLPARLPVHACRGAAGLRAGSFSLRTNFLQTWEIPPLCLAIMLLCGELGERVDVSGKQVLFSPVLVFH